MNRSPIVPQSFPGRNERASVPPEIVPFLFPVGEGTIIGERMSRNLTQSFPDPNRSRST